MKRTKKISEGVRVAQVRQLFLAQHADPAQRTATIVLIFYGWLERHRPELLPQGKHDARFNGSQTSTAYPRPNPAKVAHSLTPA